MKEIEELIDISSEMKYNIRMKDFSSIAGLIERWQSLANKVEAALYDKSDLEYYRKQSKELKAEIKELKKEKKELESVTGKVPEKEKRVRSVIDDIMGE